MEAQSTTVQPRSRPGSGTDVASSTWPSSEQPSMAQRPNPSRRRPASQGAGSSPLLTAAQQTPRARSAEVSDLVSRLSRPNTSTGRRAVLWSNPRREYEGDHNFHATIKEPNRYWTHFPGLPRHYPGTWATLSTDQVQDLVGRLTRPTTASRARASEIISRRRVVTEFFALNRSKDMSNILSSRSRASSAVTPRRTPLPPATPTATF